MMQKILKYAPPGQIFVYLPFFDMMVSSIFSFKSPRYLNS
jgi:hypothetical protein